MFKTEWVSAIKCFTKFQLSSQTPLLPSGLSPGVMACQETSLKGPRVDKIISDEIWSPHAHTWPGAAVCWPVSVKRPGVRVPPYLHQTSQAWARLLQTCQPTLPLTTSGITAARSLRWTQAVWHDGFGTLCSFAQQPDCQAKSPRRAEDEDERWNGETATGDRNGPQFREVSIKEEVTWKMIWTLWICEKGLSLEGFHQENMESTWSSGQERAAEYSKPSSDRETEQNLMKDFHLWWSN